MTALAQIVVRFKYLVVLAWIGVATLALPRSTRIDEVLQAEGQSLRTTESQRAKDLMRVAFEHSTVSFLVVAIRGPVPVDSSLYRRLLRELTTSVARQPYIEQVVSALTSDDARLVSRDRRTTFFLATIIDDFAETAGRVTPWVRETVREAQRFVPGADNFEIHVTGAPALDYDVRRVSAEDAKRAELRSLIPTAAVLVLAFGALLAAVLPIVIGVFAISCALAAVHVAASVHPMSVFVLTIVTMVGLAVGIDYSLLVVTRFREEMNRGQGARDAAIRAMETAGRAVITSGLTVLVGFAALLLTPIIETRSVGIGGMVVVAAAVCLAVTLLPAVLAILGRSIDWPRWLARRLAWYHKPTAWERWARWLAHHPVRALAIGLVVAATLTWPVFHIKIGLPTRGWFPEETESGIGAEMLERIGSRGALLPIRITLRAEAGDRLVSSQYLSGLRRFSDTIRTDPRVADVRGPADLGLSRLSYLGLFGNLDRFRDRYPEFFRAYISRDGSTTLFDVTLEDSTSFTGSMDAVRRIRDIVDGGVRGLDSVEVLVGGFAASSLDLQEDLLDGFPLVIMLVLAITGIMLLIAFRSVLVPAKAIVMNSLSVAAAFGLIVLVFQHGVGAGFFGIDGATEAIYVVTPVLVFAVVFGLSMDYEVFLLSRMKEAFDRTHKNDLATMEGLSVTASVITSAAAIMIIVFGAFAFSRVLAAQLMGFGLAVAVLLDATLIRMVLVPAIMHIAGRWNWWPGFRASRPADLPET